MKNISRFAAFFTVAAFTMPLAVSAAPADDLSGRILIDVSGHGEAWYVNPQSRMRVPLGRPHEALARLTERALPVNYMHVERLAETAGGKTDSVYAKQVAGQILLPNDVPGAAWYVDPVSGLRKRLATPADAWDVMRSGTPAGKATLRAIPIEAAEKFPRPRTETVTVKSVLDAVTLELADGAKVSILNVEVPANPELQSAAMDRIKELMGSGKEVVIERDADDRTKDLTLLRHVHARGTNLGYDLVRNGLAFHNIYDANFNYAEQFIVASLDAARLKNGFWNPAR